MLLKCTADGRRIKVNGASVNQPTVARGMKMTMSTSATMSARIHRKVIRAPHKRALPGKMATHPGKMAAHPGKMAHIAGKLGHLGKFGKMAHYAHAHGIRPPEPCDMSNDSGLGPDPVGLHRLSESVDWQPSESKRRREESPVKIESEDANDAYPFPPPAPPAQVTQFAMDNLLTPEVRAISSISSPSEGKKFQEPAAYRSCGNLSGGGKLATKYPGGGKLAGGKLGGKLGGKYGGKLAQALARRRALAMASGPAGLAAPLSCRSRDATVELQILCQPETQHRARYQTEGSRGAVKDNSGNGFPVVKLVGYDKPAVLQVFIGTDTGRVAPHMFYQACRVSGKNSTPCKERKEDGTVVIEIDLEPAKNWQVTCDCVGILKERNVDVEHRFGEALGAGAGAGAGACAGAAHVSRGKKKSTRCRMVFRTTIVNAAGQQETLQVCSTQIICTQPPGVPEVCRKSLVSSPVSGGLELYLLGKNFLKETRVVFTHRVDGRLAWEEEVVPDKEFLQQTHLVCCVPPYVRPDITEPVSVQLYVRAGGKASEPHAFYYTPSSLEAGPMHCTRHHTQGSTGDDRSSWSGSLDARRGSLSLPGADALKAECDEASRHSDASRDADTRDQGVDLRLKHEAECDAPYHYDAIKLSPPTPQSDAPSPLASFTQQLQAIQNQVQTDKMVESVTAAIFNNPGDPSSQMYVDNQMTLGMRMMPGKQLDQPEMKLAPPMLLAPPRAYEPRPDAFNPFNALTKLEMEPRQLEARLAQQSAHMEALVEDAMQATAAMLPADAAKLDELINARADDHLAAPAASLPPACAQQCLEPQVSPSLLCDSTPRLVMPSPSQDELMMMSELSTSVKTPPAAVKSMILNAAAEILTSDSTMNALVTSAINTANILTTEAADMQAAAATDAQPPAEPATEAPLAAMSQAVSQAVTQAVSQAVSHAVSQAVSQEMTAPVQGLTDMSDQDLLSYINPSTFDQV